MKVDVAAEVADFLQALGKADVTVDAADLDNSSCVSQMPELRVTYNPPLNRNRYSHFEAGGITLHVSTFLSTGDRVSVSVSGDGPLKKIKVSGIHLIM
ncbi:hypothetical protein [Nitrospina watsonii]|uniref:Uncharacterized protein n=1 Tax=Nitrospina watsonii TaxID=1323948 RepID=A0ABM9HCI4_9BACT|nr:hypothetical protein [Nitrospina watsonii]CAI2717769.1 conserved protein of unknown function [Nitrospina watsonii]